MNILVHLSHPAQFHLFKRVIKNLKEDGHNVYIIIKTKDILEDLLIDSNLPYYNVLPIAHRKSKMGVFWDLLVRDWRILLFAINHKVDILTGSTPEVAHIGWLLGRKSINVGEDDAAVIPLYIKLIKPFVQVFLAPVVCNMGEIERKSIKYAGYHKLAYLHPNRFTPQKEIVEQYFSTDSPYFLIRFAQLKAHHDVGIHGINTEIAQHLIDILKPYGRIYITSERELEPQFECYRLKINPLDIHHVMAFASLYIGDSQSMAVEAAMLGTPSLRFNDFAGRIGVLEELEHKYGLTFGIKTSNPQQLYDKIEELLHLPDLKAEFQRRRAKMLSEKIDVTAFFTWFIENYPQSAQTMKENPDYQYNFK